MKIAIILSGHLRSYRETFPSFQKLRSRLASFGQVDIFVHTWNIEESVSASWWKDHDAGVIPEPNVNETEVKELYQPVALRIEASKKFHEPAFPIKTVIPISGLLSMLYSQYAAWHLMDEYCKEKNVTYDLVLKTRYDLEYEIDESFFEKLEKASSNEVLVPNSNSFELTGACADIFALGNYHGMSEYLKFYERFDQTLSFYRDVYRELIPELLLRTYLDKYNIGVNETEGIRFTILRTNGDRLTINSDIHFDLNSPNCFFKVTIERCEKMLPENSVVLAEKTRLLVFKYLKWVDVEASEKDLGQYNDFYCGKWIGLEKIKNFVRKCRSAQSLDKKVMRSFFERAFFSSHYNWGRKIQLATVLWQIGNYGIYYFKLLGKTLKLTGKAKK